MPHEDVGQVLAGQPEDDNVNKWKDFLKRPENLSTALVFLAGIASPKQRDQSNISKALSSGVGALGSGQDPWVAVKATLIGALVPVAHHLFKAYRGKLAPGSPWL